MEKYASLKKISRILFIITVVLVVVVTVSFAVYGVSNQAEWAKIFLAVSCSCCLTSALAWFGVGTIYDLKTKGERHE